MNWFFPPYTPLTEEQMVRKMIYYWFSSQQEMKFIKKGLHAACNHWCKINNTSLDEFITELKNSSI